MEEEFDLAIFERLRSVTWTTSDDITRFLVDTLPAETFTPIDLSDLA